MMRDNIDRPAIVNEVSAAFYRYEQALINNDVAVLDELFWSDPRTVRYGISENLYGIDEIRAFRNTRSSPGSERLLQNTTITTYGDDMAVASTEFTGEGSGKIGRQMQTWVKFPYGWRIVAAHISLIG
ncbi:oxalurate catabolism protein HpxZ [Buttiauxella warmboldiae]|uniref:Oxalurate catabolism protein HpxZ n=1 Tax=Buttiauxella warmboldiae TaxID=82993 RepID=A0A3N5DM73_9ENTR|nr:oxalurate catabolism protein HpxZ [Buttiauxella warmboldiae]RPH21906.1 oxalurate catabolism protein HpxZ [Buttiauxella warmboldiae]